MRTWRRGLLAAVRRIVAVSEGLAALLLVFILACDVGQVFFRYVLVMPLSWTDEAMRYAMAWIAFLSGSALVFRGEHMAAGLFNSPRLGRVKGWIQSACLVAVGGFAVALVWYGFPLSLRNASQTSASAGIPMIVPTFSVVAGGALMVLYVLALLVAPADAVDPADPAA